jgi:hypothetical protein
VATWALSSEVLASQGNFTLSPHVIQDSITTEGRYYSEIAVQNAIANGTRAANIGGQTPIWNSLTTFQYPIA